MSKKNKEIEVRIEEVEEKKEDEVVTISKLLIGKKEIGHIIHQDPKKFAVMIDRRCEATMKSLDEAVEYIIRQWHLTD